MMSRNRRRWEWRVGVLFAAAMVAGGCQGNRKMQITEEAWGEHDGKAVQLYTLDNGRGMTAKITNYGGIVTELHVPGRDGEPVDVALGFDTLDEYVAGSPYFGAMVGRVGNRIARGRFMLDGRAYQLAQNNGPNHLHGGEKGFDKVVWEAKTLQTLEGPGLRLTYDSPDGEEGYPGTLHATVDYIVTFDNELRVDITATADASTPVNIVHHTYWNLGGHDAGTILDQVLELDASQYTPADATLIPTGQIASVSETVYDFTSPKTMGADMAQLPPTGDDPGGYDLNYVIDDADGRLRRAARVSDAMSGVRMEIWTTMPGIQLYSGNFLDGIRGKGGAIYAKNAGFCLETQYFPDAINKRAVPGWPDPVLRPGETYRHVMIHRFESLGSIR